MSTRWQTWLVHAMLLVGAAITVYPLVWMVLASLMPTGEAQSLPPRFWPSRITFVHYAELFERLNLARYFANSLLIASTVTVLSVIINSLAGYALAKLRFAGRDGLFRLLAGRTGYSGSGGDDPAVPVHEATGVDQHLLGRDSAGVGEHFWHLSRAAVRAVDPRRPAGRGPSGRRERRADLLDDRAAAACGQSWSRWGYLRLW